MKNLMRALTLRQQMAIHSDRLAKEASAFADAHSNLWPRRITASQLYGFGNIVRNARRVDDIQIFIRHQAEKAGRARRSDVQGYWGALSKRLAKLDQLAQEIRQQVLEETGESVEMDELHRKLISQFAQHLIAHTGY
jgi:hypothetical protein